ncbi:SRPBCC family protein [Bacillus sp. V5-8f]|uniref:SRPBCC family protein n=1 Tax=Bacillus sp. V5-8f TaxID=2053044 RepID=UPI000C76153E|nr:SRPBCC family protein [Bacillus sp. V5-8f]PLT33150.1 hypothetical protein CUU64_15335 [Bacillus sp. V5-8f]
MDNRTFVYVTYISTTPEKIWEGLTNGDISQKYFFGTRVDSDWKVGSPVTYSRNGMVSDYGNVLKYEPQSLLSFTWTYKGDNTPRQSPTRVTFTLKPMDKTVKLTLKHENLLAADFVENDDTFEGYNNGWPAVLSNLKSFLETGETLPVIRVD